MEHMYTHRCTDTWEATLHGVIDPPSAFFDWKIFPILVWGIVGERLAEPRDKVKRRVSIESLHSHKCTKFLILHKRSWSLTPGRYLAPK